MRTCSIVRHPKPGMALTYDAGEHGRYLDLSPEPPFSETR